MKIMVCYDGSDEAKEGLRVAGRHALAFNGEVVVVTSVVADKRIYPKMMEPHEQALKEAHAFFLENEVPCRTTISFRDVDVNAGEDLVLFSMREPVDEIVIGIRSRSKVGKFLLGSAAQWIMLKAQCPVLGVKKKGALAGF